MGFLDEIYFSELSPKAKHIYMYFKERTGKKENCYPSLKRIAKDTGLSRSSVQRAIKELEKGRWIEIQTKWRENGSQSSNIYIVSKNTSEE